MAGGGHELDAECDRSQPTVFNTLVSRSQPLQPPAQTSRSAGPGQVLPAAHPTCPGPASQLTIAEHQIVAFVHGQAVVPRVADRLLRTAFNTACAEEAPPQIQLQGMFTACWVAGDGLGGTGILTGVTPCVAHLAGESSSRPR